MRSPLIAVVVDHCYQGTKQQDAIIMMITTEVVTLEESTFTHSRGQKDEEAASDGIR